MENSKSRVCERKVLNGKRPEGPNQKRRDEKVHKKDYFTCEGFDGGLRRN